MSSEPRRRSDFTPFVTTPQSHCIKECVAAARASGIQVETVVITGGPCAGKTSILSYLETDFKERGWFVVMVPEAATIVRGAGFKAETGVITVHNAQMMMIAQNEFGYLQALTHSILSGQRKILIIRDRSSLDGAAYMPSLQEFDRLARDMGLNTRDLAEATAIIHLTSLAVDQPRMYEELKGNNPIRFETVAEAIAADQRTLGAYEHFCTKVHKVENGSTSFSDKINAVTGIILEAIGDPKVEKEDAYILRGNIGDWRTLVDKAHKVVIEQFFVSSGVRYRMEEFPNGDAAYTRTIKMATDNPATRFEDITRISANEYFSAKNGHDVDPKRKVIVKNRWIFNIQEGQTTHRGELDEYLGGELGKALRLEIEFTDVRPPLPSYLLRGNWISVTGKEEYSNSSIAAGTCPKPFG